MIQWNLLDTSANPGEAFNQSFRESRTRGALEGFASNPNSATAANVFANNPQMGALAQQFSARQEERDRSDDMRGAMAKTYSPETGLDTDAAIGVMASRGDIGGAMAMRNQQTERDTAIIEQNREELGLISQLTQGVTDQASYTTALQAAGRYDLDTSQMPQSFEEARPMLDEFARLGALANEQQNPTSLMQNIEYLRTLNPTATDAELAEIARRNINRPVIIAGQSGSQFEYDPTAPSSYAAPNAGGASEEQLRAQAAAAIAAGADPAAVNQRLEEMLGGAAPTPGTFPGQ